MTIFRKTICAALAGASLFTFAPHLAAQETIEQAPSQPVRVQLDAMPTGALVTLMLRDILRVPYVIAPEVLRDKNPVSVNLTLSRSNLPREVIAFIRSLGMNVELVGGAVHVTGSRRAGVSPAGVSAGTWGGGQSRPATSVKVVPSGSPLVPPGEASSSAVRSSTRPVLDGLTKPEPTIIADQQAIALIRPAHVEIGELADTFREILPALLVSARTGSQPRGEVIRDRQLPDGIVIAGTPMDVALARELFEALDVPREMVNVDAAILEVRTAKAKGSALSIVAGLFGGGEATIGADAVGNTSLSLGVGGLNARLSLIAQDNRVSVVARPSIALLSGATGQIIAGASVPTLGAVSFTDDGQPIRSVSYQDSGVTLRVTPQVRDGHIRLDVDQERSTFVRTDTGVDDSPTLLTNSALTTVAIESGETVAIAALDERRDESVRDGLFGGLLGTRRKAVDTSQLVLLLEAGIKPHNRTARGTFQLLSTTPPQSLGETGSDNPSEPTIPVPSLAG